MTNGTTLLKLQDLDLQIERDRQELADMPQIKELARKRKAYLKLKADFTKLVALRKDIENDLAELDDDEKFCNAAVDQAQVEMNDPENYAIVKEFELQLAGIAKRMDKIEFSRKQKQEELAAALDREKRGQAVICDFEKTVVAETRAAREHAAEVQNRIDVNEARRAAILNTMDQALKEIYEMASKRFRGLFVEELNGNVPSICRTSLQPSSMDQIAGVEEFCECPYCHRILVVAKTEEE